MRGSLILEERTVHARGQGDLGRDLRQCLVSVDAGVRLLAATKEGHGRHPGIIFIHTSQPRRRAASSQSTRRSVRGPADGDALWPPRRPSGAKRAGPAAS